MIIINNYQYKINNNISQRIHQSRYKSKRKMSEYNFFCKIKYALENSNLIVAAVWGYYNKIKIAVKAGVIKL